MNNIQFCVTEKNSAPIKIVIPKEFECFDDYIRKLLKHEEKFDSYLKENPYVIEYDLNSVSCHIQAFFYQLDHSAIADFRFICRKIDQESHRLYEKKRYANKKYSGDTDICGVMYLNACHGQSDREE